MKTNIFFILPFTILLFSSCLKKKEEAQLTTVTGQVRTYGTEERIRHPSVKVQIVEKQETSHWLGGEHYEPVAEIMSDENQNFSLTHSLDPEKEYFLAVDRNTVKEKRHYVEPEFHFGHHKIRSRGGTVNLNYYLSAYGWVKFHFVSENYQEGDRYTYSVGGGGYEEFYGPVDTYRVWDYSANREHDVVYTTVRNGEYMPTREYFTPPHLDTMTYEVKFK